MEREKEKEGTELTNAYYTPATPRTHLRLERDVLLDGLCLAPLPLPLLLQQLHLLLLLLLESDLAANLREGERQRGREGKGGRKKHQMHLLQSLWLSGCYTHVNSFKETRQSKQLRPKTTPFFSREKMSCLRPQGGIRTCNILRARQTLYQLSHRGSSAGQAESLKFIHTCMSQFLSFFPPHSLTTFCSRA